MAYIELDEYLALEAASSCRHEYLDGVVYAIPGEPARGMAGGSAAQADITRNAGFALHARLKGSPCRVKMSDMRLRIDAAGSVFYPDVLVHCEPVTVPAAATELTQARLVIEVLSPTSQQFDRGSKLLAYQQLAGLIHVILSRSGCRLALGRGLRRHAARLKSCAPPGGRTYLKQERLITQPARA